MAFIGRSRTALDLPAGDDHAVLISSASEGNPAGDGRRWGFRLEGVEGGVADGAALTFVSHDNVGEEIGVAVSLARSTGDVTVKEKIQSSATHPLVLRGAAGQDVTIESDADINLIGNVTISGSISANKISGAAGTCDVSGVPDADVVLSSVATRSIDITAGTGGDVNITGATIALSGTVTGLPANVASIEADGSTLTGAVELVAGTNVTLGVVGQQITINSTGGGGGGGTLTGITAGTGILVTTPDPLQPTVANDGVLTFNGVKGSASVSAGAGISVTGTAPAITVNNTGVLSFDSLTGAVASKRLTNQYFVAKNGNDTTGTGSSLNPYLTIQKAINESKLGRNSDNIAIVFVAPGDYIENITIDKGYIVLQGITAGDLPAPGSEITGSVTISVANAVDDIYGNRVTFDGFTITGLVTDNSAIKHSLSFVNCYLNNGGGGRLFIQESLDDCRTYITNCEMTRTAGGNNSAVACSIGWLILEDVQFNTATNEHILQISGAGWLSRATGCRFESSVTNVATQPMVHVVSNATPVIHAFERCSFVFTSQTGTCAAGTPGAILTHEMGGTGCLISVSYCAFALTPAMVLAGTPAIDSTGGAGSATIFYGSDFSFTPGGGSGGQIGPNITKSPLTEINPAQVTSATAGTGISVSASTGAVTFTNTGVTSAVAGTGIGVSAATGAVTISNNGVTGIKKFGEASSLTGAVTLTQGAGMTLTQTAGNISIDNAGVTSAIAGTGIGVSGGTGAVTISNSGVTSIIAGTNVSISSTGAGGTGAVTINSSGGGGGSTAAGTPLNYSYYDAATAYTIGQKAIYKGRVYQATGSTTGTAPIDYLLYDDFSGYCDGCPIYPGATAIIYPYVNTENYLDPLTWTGSAKVGSVGTQGVVTQGTGNTFFTAFFNGSSTFTLEATMLTVPPGGTNAWFGFKQQNGNGFYLIPNNTGPTYYQLNGVTPVGGFTGSGNFAILQANDIFRFLLQPYSINVKLIRDIAGVPTTVGDITIAANDLSSTMKPGITFGIGALFRYSKLVAYADRAVEVAKPWSLVSQPVERVTFTNAAPTQTQNALYGRFFVSPGAIASDNKSTLFTLMNNQVNSQCRILFTVQQYGTINPENLNMSLVSIGEGMMTFYLHNTTATGASITPFCTVTYMITSPVGLLTY